MIRWIVYQRERFPLPTNAKVRRPTCTLGTAHHRAQLARIPDSCCGFSTAATSGA